MGGIVLQAELIVDNTIRLLCLGIHMLTSVVVIAVVWPFKSTPNNIFQLCVGIACTIQLILFSDSDQIEGSNSDQSSVSRNVLIALVVFVVVALAVYRFSLRLCRRSKGGVEPSDTSSYDGSDDEGVRN